MTKNPPAVRQTVPTLTRRRVDTSIKRLRYTLLVGLIVVLAGVAKLVEIQIINADMYAETSVRQRVRLSLIHI